MATPKSITLGVALPDATGGYYDAIGSYRYTVNYESEVSETIRVSAEVYLSGGQQTPSGNNFFSAAIAARTLLNNASTAGTGELAISSDGHVYGYSGNDNVPIFQTSAPISLNAWHNLAVDVDPGARIYLFSVDDQPLGTFAFATPDPDDPAVDYTTVFARGSLVTYAGADSNSLNKHNFTAHYDNFSISTSPLSIPEPATGCLLSTGMIVYLRSVRFRRRQ